MPDAQPLAGIRVFELSVAIAGPTCGRYLARYGAEVIKVESLRNPDVSRLIGSGWLSPETYGMQAWVDTSVSISEWQTGKLGLGVDLKAPAGKEAARRLLAQCDVLLTNYSAPAVRDLGLDYESVRQIRPDIVYAGLSGFGATPDDPYYEFLAWGPNQAPLTGIDELTGWPDRPPSGVLSVSYPDYSNGLHGLVAVLAALEHRDRTGEGQFIDLAQYEATVALLGPLLLNQQVNGKTATRTGNRAPWGAPQGVYPTRDVDDWVAISALEPEEWDALCLATGHLDWHDDPDFQTAAARYEHHDRLDDLIASWTSSRTGDEVASLLQEAGVPAYPVQDNAGMLVDPQLLARNFWLVAPHARVGLDVVTGYPIHMTPEGGHVRRAAPIVGEDNAYILGEICGYSSDEIQAMAEQGAIFPAARPDVKLQRPYMSWLPQVMPRLPWPSDQS